MTNSHRTHLSKFLSKHLRHAPEAIGIALEPDGWVSINDLIAASTQVGMSFTREELDEVVRTSDKQRFAIDEGGSKIRANQGHSAEVELRFEEAEPPALLYHGTPVRNLEAILSGGLLKMARHHVHRSPDTETAAKVGQRRGEATILVVEASRMRERGHVFFRSANGVWLVERVPPEFIRVLAAIASV